MAKAKTVLTIREWPIDLHRALRSKAALEGKTLREVLEEAGRDWLKRKRDN